MSDERTMRPFEYALRLLLELHVLMESGKEDSPEADAIRDKMDGPFGWCASSPEERLSDREAALLTDISCAFYGDLRDDFRAADAANEREKKRDSLATRVLGLAAKLRLSGTDAASTLLELWAIYEDEASERAYLESELGLKPRAEPREVPSPKLPNYIELLAKIESQFETPYIDVFSPNGYRVGVRGWRQHGFAGCSDFSAHGDTIEEAAQRLLDNASQGNIYDGQCPECANTTDF